MNTAFKASVAAVALLLSVAASQAALSNNGPSLKGTTSASTAQPASIELTDGTVLTVK